MTSAGVATWAVRVLAAHRCMTGAALLVRPDAVSRAVAADAALPPGWLVRVLGGRLVCQGLLEWRRPTRTVVLAGAAVDVVHALSMFAVAAVLPAYRRIAIASATEATASAQLHVAFACRLL